MSRVNSYLLSSLMWNLREMTNLIKLLRSNVGEIQISSWRHPLIPCGELDVLRLLEDNKDCDRYTYLLELTFDRLLYILNLIINYLEGCNDLAKFKPGKNIERPSNLSLASLLYMIWDRIQVHCEAAEDLSKTIHSRSISSSSTQSDITSISSCSTCELAQKLVTEIVIKMENYFLDNASESVLLAERKILKEKLVTASSWSAMMTWVNVVLKDITTLLEEIQKYKTDNKSLKKLVDSADSNLTSKVKKYEEEVRAMQRICRESEEKLRNMEREMRTLKEEKQRQHEELKTLNIGYIKNLADLESRKRSLEDKIAERDRIEEERTSEWKTKLETEVRKRDCLEREMESIKRSLAGAERETAQANSIYMALEVKLKQAMDQVGLLKEEKEKLQASLKEKQDEVDRYSSKLLEAFPDISENNKNKYKGTGDPLTDMRHQIEANKLRIYQLSLQNESLHSTITKIETFKK